ILALGAGISRTASITRNPAMATISRAATTRSVRETAVILILLVITGVAGAPVRLNQQSAHPRARFIPSDGFCYTSSMANPRQFIESLGADQFALAVRKRLPQARPRSV